MLVLDATTKSLEVKLAGAITATQLPYVASYVDISQSTFGVVGSSESDGTTNNATAVTVVAAPGASTSRKLNFLSVFNVDTVQATVTVQVNNSGTLRICWRGLLAVGDTLQYIDEKGFLVTDINGSLKQSGSTGATGATGAIGPVGMGIPGIDGEDGADGWPGERGLPGVAGSNGATGATGPIGQGVPGMDGEDGLDSLFGVPGNTGPAGPAGVPGANGPSGPIGPPGAGEDSDASDLFALVGYPPASATALNAPLPTLQGGWGTSTPEVPTTGRLTSDMVISSTTTLATVAGTTLNVLAGKAYRFEALFAFTSVDATGGAKTNINGTATMTSYVADLKITNDSSNAVLGANNAFNSSSGQTTASAYQWIYKGCFVVNAAGTIRLEAAQSSASGTSTLKTNSYLTISPVN